VKYTSRVDWLQSTYTLSFPGDVQGSDPNADLAPLDCARRALFANDNCKETHCKWHGGGRRLMRWGAHRPAVGMRRRPYYSCNATCRIRNAAATRREP